MTFEEALEQYERSQPAKTGVTPTGYVCSQGTGCIYGNPRRFCALACTAIKRAAQSPVKPKHP